ncbi:hypothetical protein MRX96_038307 [Rhipicephalus microplus]
MQGSRRRAERGSSADEEAGPSDRLSSASVGAGPNSHDFWATFYRLRSVCSRLERRMRLHASPMWAPPHAPTATRSDSLRTASLGATTPTNAAAASRRTARMSAPGPSSSFMAGLSSTASSSSNREAASSETHPDMPLSLASLLARLETSLQSLSSVAFTTAVARDQIHQVRLRITEISERLANVSGYRARLTSLRDQIVEAAAAASRSWSGQPGMGSVPEAEAADHHSRASVAAERRRGGGIEDDTSRSQQWDLVYCLWLVEISLQLTRQMQRILADDYRRTQVHLNPTSTSPGPSASVSPPSFSPPSSSSSSTAYGNDSYLRSHSTTRGNSGLLSAAASAASTSGRPGGLASAPLPSHRPMHCPRLRHYHHHPQNRRVHASPVVNGSSGSALALPSSSSDSLDSSDEESLDFGSMEVDAAGSGSFPPASLSRRRSRMLRRNRFWPASPPPIVPEEDPPLPEVHVSPPSSPPPVRVRLAWCPPSDSSRLSFSPSTTYFSIFYEGGFRPRLSVYEAGPNLTHRIQCWDMTGSKLPDIGDAKACLVAPRCKIHNDASVALGGGLLAALVPCGLLGASLCVYSLQPRGTLLHTWSFGANAISVSLSPLARYLVVGFATTRGYFSQEREVVAQIFKLTPQDGEGSSSSSSLQQVGNLSQPGGTAGQPPVSLNSVRWLPRPGEGLIYGTNRGSLCICRPIKPISKEGGSTGASSRTGPTRDATSPFCNAHRPGGQDGQEHHHPGVSIGGTDTSVDSSSLSSGSSNNEPVPGPSGLGLDAASSSGASTNWYTC